MVLMTLTSKGQMTLPKAVRDELALRAGDKIELAKDGDRYVLIPRKRGAAELFGMLRRPGQVAQTTEEMDDALGEALAEDDERIRAGR